MTQAGSQPVSLRGDATWRGYTTLTISERGDRRPALLENCYVSSDGAEIRTFPGWKCVVDFTTTPSYGTGKGWDTSFVDAARPVSASTATYFQHVGTHTSPTSSQSLYCWVNPTNLHGFKFVRGKPIVFGESDFRKEFIFTVTDDILEIVSYAATGTDTFIALSGNYKTYDPTAGTPTSDFNAFPINVWGPSTETVVVYIENTGLPALDNKFHLMIDAFSANTITINTDIGSGSAADLHGRIYRVRPDFATPAETGLTYYQDGSCDDPESLTTWEMDNLFDVTSVVHSGSAEGCKPAMVANRRRDFGDPILYRWEASQSHDYGRRRQKSIPYRLVPDLSGERLLLAAPGYGCVFQVPRILPVGNDSATPNGDTITYRTNDQFDMPRCVGIPKAVMWEDTDKTVSSGTSTYHVYSVASAAYSFGGTTETTRAGVYKFVVAYRDDATGEIGLPSEVITITTSALHVAHQGIRLAIMPPGYLMSECLATSMVVYRTIAGGSTFYKCAVIGALNTFSIKYGLPATVGVGAGVANIYYEFTVPYVDDATLALDTTPLPVLEQMPMGAKAVKTVRNYTWYGGQIGNCGPRKELWWATITPDYNGTLYPNFNEVTTATLGTDLRFTGDLGWMCAQGGIPPAYANSISLFSIEAWPFPVHTVSLGDMVNLQGGWTSGSDPSPMGYLRYKVEGSPLQSGTNWTPGSQYCWAILERGLYQVSEANAPGVVASHSQWVNAEKEEDIEAIGQCQGGVVFCTRSNTYYVNWSRTPFLDGIEPVQPDQVSAEFGCIAANSMVEFDGGCAWISDRGPVAMMGGVVTWIGQDLELDFLGSGSRYKRDREGMMRHAWACHDPERGLVYFGLYANKTPALAVTYRGTSYAWDDASDECRSRFPCDEVLVWNYRLNAWSRWVPPTGMEVLWMERGYDVAGAQRVFFLCRDNRIYALDDTFSDRNVTQISTSASNDGTASTSLLVPSVSIGNDEAAIDNNTYVAIGMGVLIQKQNTSEPTIRGYSTIANVDTVTGEITLNDPMTWVTGDAVYIGVRSSTIRSNYLNLSGDEAIKSGRKVGLRYSVRGGYAAWKATQTVNKRVDDSSYANNASTVSMMGSAPAIFMGSDTTASSLKSRYQTTAKGLASGQDLQVELTIYHAGQVRISDIVLEAP